MKISIDFETYSECDLKTAGAWAYAEHPSTEPLCLAYAVDDGEPVLWTPDQGDPVDLFDLIEAGGTLHAWNSFFEFVIWHLCCRWPAVPVRLWNDTAARAAMAAMPRSLAACGAALGLPAEHLKSKRGSFLISRLCMPFKGRRVTDPDLLGELYDYCRQDVVAERAIGARLPPMPRRERALWELDQEINIRGVGIDLARVDDAVAIVDAYQRERESELWTLTGAELSDVRSVSKVVDFLDTRGVDVPALDKTTVADALKTIDDPVARGVLEIRQALGKTSTKKYETLRAIAGQDGRAHGLLRYHGATTGRWSGALFQPQNLPRPTIDDVDGAIGAFPLRSPAALAQYGEPMEVLSSCVRGMLVPAPGEHFAVADYSSIEPRVLAWLAGQADVLDVFRNGGDLYVHAAARIYGVPPDQVTKEQRFTGKVATLALGYAGGVRALSGMARNYGTELPDDECEEIKTAWRAANPEVVRLWRNVDNAAIRCVRDSTPQVVAGAAVRIVFEMVRDWLTIRLPSGRRLWYYEPRLVNRDEFADGRFGSASYDNVEFSGVDTYTRQWTRIRTYGGKLVENIVQAIARDVMADAMLRVERAGFRVVLTVHDEIVAEFPDVATMRPAGHFADVADQFAALMCELPAWADGLPVAAVGQVMRRYGK